MNELEPGRNAIGGCITTIERLRQSCQIVLGRWSHFSQPSFAVAMPVYFAKRCMKSIFHEFSEEKPPSQRKVLGARGPLLSALVHFFEHRSWGSPIEGVVEEHSLSAEDRLFIQMQVGPYLTATRGFAAAEVRICYESAASLSHSLNRPLLLYAALMGQWRHSNNVEKQSAALQIAKRIYSLAQKQNESPLLLGAFCALAITHFFLGNFETSRQSAARGLEILRSGGATSPVEEVDLPAVNLLCYKAILDWHFEEIASGHAMINEAISLAKELNDMHGLAVALCFAAALANRERSFADAARYSSDLIALSTRHNFAHWLALGAIYNGWGHSALGNAEEGISWIEHGIRDLRATGAVTAVPHHLSLKAEALHQGIALLKLFRQ